MKKQPSEELLEAIAEAAKALGASDATSSNVIVTMPIICDSCQNEDKEAFWYCVNDESGKYWEHLCNICFDELGCRYDWTDDELDEGEE